MTVTVTIRGNIAHVTIDNPPVNALSLAVRQGLLQAVKEVSASGARAALLSCAGRTFVAGADVREFDLPPAAPHLPDVLAAIEACPVPWAAVMQGSALGGGMELALACRWRIARPGTRLGLPEVTLGLIPGAGGTVRLPRLIGMRAAVAMVTSGKPVTAEAARESGLVDAILAEGEEDWLQEALSRPVPQPLTAHPADDPGALFWDETRAALTRSAKGNPAPVEALSVMSAGANADTETALALERATFLRLRASDQAAALRHLFLAERTATRPPEIAALPPRPLRQAGVVGGGTMGAGIATALLQAGLSVHLTERDEAAAARARATVEGLLDTAARRGLLSPAKLSECLQNLTTAAGNDGLADADIVVEAVFEDLTVKRRLFAGLAQICRADTLLATNTSYLDPRLIFGNLAPSGRCLGLHFFSPAQVMKLVEIVPLPDTAADVLATGFDLVRRMGKIPVRAGICDGFIGNRILKLTRMQAERLLLSGCTPSQVDAALRGFGFAMGPFETQDMGGLDIAVFQRSAARDRGEVPFAPVADRLVALGRLGRKTAGGWYDYASNGKPRPELPEAVADAITAARRDLDSPARPWTAAEIVEAVLFPMIDEALRLVEEGIALREVDVDLVLVHGYGFPRHRGGPVHYGRRLGLDRVATRLAELAAQDMAPQPSAALGVPDLSAR